MTPRQDAIIKALSDGASKTGLEIAQATTFDIRDIVSDLHVMQDAGTVFLRNGFFRLSEHAKQEHTP